jgi:signal transduction histidine kinase
VPDRNPSARSAATLVRFSRLIAESDAKEQILPLLLEAAATHAGAQASAVLEVGDDGAVRLTFSRELPEPVAAWCAGRELLIDSELEASLLGSTAGHYTQVHVLPLVSGGDLFGALVLFFVSDELRGEKEVAEVLAGLCDLAAIAIRKVHQFQALQRSLAEVQASRELLARSEKLRALGQMAAGVSHDLVNILNPLSIDVQRLERRFSQAERPVDREGTLQVLERMGRVLHQGMETIRRLRDFGRQAPERTEHQIDLDSLVRESLALVKPRLGDGSRISLIEELSGPPALAVERAELVAAVLNLLVNAIDAMPAAGGTITVRTGAEAGEQVWVEVSDTGTGIPLEVEQRMFEPFFTTKGSEGTGLGLAMVYAFVQRHGGKIAVRTAPGRGTTIRLCFPLR